MRRPHVLCFGSLARLDGAGGIATTPLVSEAVGATNVTTGSTLFPPGTGLALHSHNTDEQVTVIEGEATVQIEETRKVLHPYDTTFIPSGIFHRFFNQSSNPVRILWIYTGVGVTRTLAETGETVSHLSGSDIRANHRC